MRRLTVLTAALLSSSTFAATAAADTLSGLCRNLEARLERCNGEGRLSTETRASCDRVEHGLRELCGDLGTIYASPSADSATLDLLDEDHEVVPIEDANGDAFPNHVVIGPSDLDDPDVIAPLRDAYAVGRTVAITDATEEEARRFHSLIRLSPELDCAAPEPRGSEIALYGLQQSSGEVSEASYCLQGLDEGNPAADRQWLRGRFAPMPTSSGDATALTGHLPFGPQLPGTGAQSYNCYFKTKVDDVGSIAGAVYVWSMRNFLDEGFCKNNCTPENRGSDYYLVISDPGFTIEATDFQFYTVEARRLTSAGQDLDTDFVEFANPPLPASVGNTRSYNTGTQTTIGGSVGVGATKKGPDVHASVNYSVTTTNSHTVNIPMQSIANDTDVDTAEPAWKFTPHSTSATTAQFPTARWTWIVGRQAYPDGGIGNGRITFDAGANIFTKTANTDVFPPCSPPYGFTAWTINQPKLTALQPSSVSSQGGNFNIHGQYLYPSGIQVVLVAGDPLITKALSFVNAELIEAVLSAELNLPTGPARVQVVTQGLSARQPSNILDLTITDAPPGE